MGNVGPYTVDHVVAKARGGTDCQGLFTSNLIASDFEDVQVLEVVKRDFPQQPDGAGIHVSFSVSWHAVGKTEKQGLEVLLSENGD